jgi:tetratricopeptide (TPR) repeat protein
MERLLTEGYYYTRGPKPDHDRALAAYEEAIRLDSTTLSALNNAAVVYGQQRDYERAEVLYRKAVAVPRSFGGAFLNLMQEQVRNGRPGGLDSTVVAFKARLPGSSDLWQAEWLAAWGKGQVERADSIGRAAWRRSPGVRQAVRAALGISSIAYLHGHRREGLRWSTLRSEAMLRAVPTAASRLAFSLDTAFDASWAGDAAAGRAAIDRGLVRQPIDSVPPDERDWEELAVLGAALAHPALSRRALAGFDQDQQQTARDPIGRRAFFAAHVALAEGKWDDALAQLREADARKTVEDRYALVQMGRAHEAAGRPDSALGYYEKFLAMPDPFPVLDARWRPQVHQWLGAIYEGRGESRKAMEQYARFLALWAQADPEFQPQVKEIRGRLERLRAAVG